MALRIILITAFALALFHPTNGQSVKGDIDSVALAERLIDKGDFGEAIALLDPVIKANPRHPPAYATRGFAKFLGGQLDGALADFDTALRLAPAAAGAERVYNNRGVVYQMKGNLEMALKDFDRAIAINENYPYAYNERDDEAQQDFDRSFSLDEELKSTLDELIASVKLRRI